MSPVSASPEVAALLRLLRRAEEVGEIAGSLEDLVRRWFEAT